MPTSAISPARMTARGAVLALGFLLVISATVGWARTARADSASSLLALTNHARATNGLPALAESADLNAAARKQASWMATHRVLAHTPDLPQAVCCWSAIGENVGEGSSPAVLQSAFMASAPHRANILSSTYSQVGVGVAADATGQLWVSVIFRAPSGAQPKPAPKPRPAPVATPTSHSTPKPSRPSSPPATASHPVAPRTPASAGVETPAGPAGSDRASRSLPGGRLPLAAAEQFAAQIAASQLPTGPDPVSSLLDFAAVTADSSN